LLDSNIILYAYQEKYADLREFIKQHAPLASAVSYVETLGYHALTMEEQHYLECFFDSTEVLPVSQAVIEQAAHLRQQRKMSLGDALIASTALVHGLVLIYP